MFRNKELLITLALICCEIIAPSAYADPTLNYLNRSVDPCDDFYQFTCGNFASINPLPPDEEFWDHFVILQRETYDLVKKILQSERVLDEPEAVQKAKAFYTACNNVEYIDELTFERTEHPMLKVLNSLQYSPFLSDNNDVKLSWNEIGDIIAEYGLPLYFTLDISNSYFDPIPNLIWGDALENPDAGIVGGLQPRFDYLKRKDGVYEQFLEEVTLHMYKTFNIHNIVERIQPNIARTVEFMRDLDDIDERYPNASIGSLYNEITLGVLQEWTDEHFDPHVLGLNWVEFINHAIKYSGSEVNDETPLLHNIPEYIYGVLRYYMEANSHDVNDFVFARLLTHMAGDGDGEMRASMRRFYKTMGYRTFNRDDYCVRKVLGYPLNIDLSMAVVYEYVRQHYNDPSKLTHVAEMLNDLDYAVHRVISNAEWMDANTTEAALNKLQQMVALFGYPEWATDGASIDKFYQNLRICAWDHFGNSQRLRAFRHAVKMSEIGKARNRAVWNYSPMEVNALYNRGNNRMLLPISILNSPFFNGNLSAFDYGRIGAIIGHEITHGFDDKGKQHNADGMFFSWWSDATKEAFNVSKACFIEQYSSYYIEEIDAYVDGTGTLNENLADNGGLRAAYHAFKQFERRHSGSNNRQQRVEEFTSDQLFFIGYGTMWCMLETPSYLQQQHEKTTYAPGRYRVIGSITNMREFADAFDCSPSSRMNPADKCVLW